MKKLLALLILLTSFAAQAAVNENDNDGAKGASGLPLPRYASLRTNDVNMRTGPGTRYPIRWVYARQGLPVEIIAEYDIWRRVRDPDGAEGWMHKSALSGKRMGIITGSPRELYDGPDAASGIDAHLELGSTGQVISCAAIWCKVKFGGVKGYVHKTDFWGAYPNEIFD